MFTYLDQFALHKFSPSLKQCFLKEEILVSLPSPSLKSFFFRNEHAFPSPSMYILVEISRPCGAMDNIVLSKMNVVELIHVGPCFHNNINRPKTYVDGWN